MPPTIIYANLLPFLGLLSLLFFLRINPLFNLNQHKMFVRAIFFVLFILVAISIDYYFSLSPIYMHAWIIRSIASFFNFAGACIIPLILIRIFVNKKPSFLLYIPAILNAIICFISIPFKLVFYFPKSGGYERGSLFFIPFITTLFYLFYLLFLSIKNHSKRPLESIFLVSTMMGISFTMVLEIAGYYKFISWDFAAVAIILYYLLLNINRSKLDPLTQTYNRAMFNKKIESLNHNSPCLIAMMDINNFKKINDEKGHEEGDKVLINFVDVVSQNMNSNNVLYRFGGDEFVVLSTDKSIDKLKERMENCFEDLAKVDLHCAIGYYSYDTDMNIDDAIRFADQNMYENKQKYHLKNT